MSLSATVSAALACKHVCCKAILIGLASLLNRPLKRMLTFCSHEVVVCHAYQYSIFPNLEERHITHRKIK